MKDALLHLLARTWRNVRAEAWANIGALLAVGLAVSIPLVFSLLAWNLSRLVQTFIGQIEVVAYVSVDASEAQVQAAVEKIRQLPPVETVSVVTSQQALARLAEELPEAAGVARELGDNPLPPSLEITLKAAYRELPPSTEFAEQIGRLPGIVEVDDGRQWIVRLSRLIRYLWVITLIMGVFLLAAAGLLVGDTIRLAIYRRRDEIAIYRLVGATNRFIRGPLFLEGVLQGVGGSLVGLLLCLGLYRYLLYRLATVGRIENWLLGGGIEPVWFNAPMIAAAVLTGGAIGFLASFLSTRRFLRT
jgi:cell division transport system permease protein